MAITIFRRVIKKNNVRIINKSQEKKEHKEISIRGNIKSTKHTLVVERDYD